MHGITFFEMCSLTLYIFVFVSGFFPLFSLVVFCHTINSRCSWCLRIFWGEQKKKRDKSIHAWISFTARTLRKVIDRQHKLRLPYSVSHLVSLFHSFALTACSIKWNKTLAKSSRNGQSGSLSVHTHRMHCLSTEEKKKRQKLKTHAHNSDGQLTSLLCFPFFRSRGYVKFDGGDI